MTRMLLSLALAATLSLTPALAGAACLAEYKAKRDDPLTLFYEVARIEGPCTVENARAQIEEALAQEGLTLLKILSVGDH